MLSFFRKSARQYSEIQQMSARARKFIRHYKKLFNEISARNQGNNSLSLALDGAQRKTPIIDRMGENVKLTGDNDEEVPATTNTGVDSITQNSSNNVVRYANKKYDAETANIREQLKNSQNTLNQMDVVFLGDVPLGFSSKTEAKQWADQELKKYGYQVDKQGIGVIEFSQKDIYGAIEHLTNGAEIAAIVAIPRVIKRGKQIGEHGNHKQREKHTVTFAAPIELNGVRGNMAVVVNMKNKKYYVHRVLLPNGTAFKFEQKKNAEQEMQRGVPRRSLANATSSASNNSITENAEKINPSDENSSKKTPKKRFALTDEAYLAAVESGDMDTVQAMVDEAAKEAGYAVRGFHATNAEFTEFDISKTSDINYHGKGIYFTNSQKDVESNYENYEGPDPWQKIEAEAYELLYDKYGLSYEDTLTSDSEIINKLNECYDEVIDKFKKTLRRITAYLKFDNPLIIGKHEQVSDFDMSKYDGIIDKNVYENIEHSGMDEGTIHYVVLNPKNIKSADPVTYDDNGNVIPLSKRFNPANPDIRFALTDYTEEQYNSFGWANEAGALTSNEIDDLYSKINEKTTLRTFKQSSRGEAIIEVNKKPRTTLDVDNVFVFVKGKKNDFYVNRVIRFNAETETEMDIIKEHVYEGRTCSDTYIELYKKEGTAREYRREDSPTFATYRKGRSNGEKSRGTNQDNRGRAKYRSGYSLSLGEDGEFIERYALTGNEDIDAIFAEMGISADNANFDVNRILERGIPRKPGTSTLTIGEMKKTIANNTHYQVFSKGKALEVIGRMFGTSDLTAKTRAKLADALWQGFNDCTDVEVAVHISQVCIAKLMSMARIKPYVNNQINNGNLLDASAKKAPKWFTTRGLQLPKVVQTIIDVNNSITENAEKSNPSDENS